MLSKIGNNKETITEESHIVNIIHKIPWIFFQKAGFNIIIYNKIDIRDNFNVNWHLGTRLFYSRFRSPPPPRWGGLPYKKGSGMPRRKIYICEKMGIGITMNV